MYLEVSSTLQGISTLLYESATFGLRNTFDHRFIIIHHQHYLRRHSTAIISAAVPAAPIRRRGFSACPSVCFLAAVTLVLDSIFGRAGSTFTVSDGICSPRFIALILLLRLLSTMLPRFLGPPEHHLLPLCVIAGMSRRRLKMFSLHDMLALGMSDWCS